MGLLKGGSENLADSRRQAKKAGKKGRKKKADKKGRQKYLSYITVPLQ
jgi:hypothetical protein